MRRTTVFLVGLTFGLGLGVNLEPLTRRWTDLAKMLAERDALERYNARIATLHHVGVGWGETIDTDGTETVHDIDRQWNS